MINSMNLLILFTLKQEIIMNSVASLYFVIGINTLVIIMLRIQTPLAKSHFLNETLH